MRFLGILLLFLVGCSQAEVVASANVKGVRMELLNTQSGMCEGPNKEVKDAKLIFPDGSSLKGCYLMDETNVYTVWENRKLLTIPLSVFKLTGA